MAKNEASDLIKAVGYYDGNSARGNFDVQLKVKFMNSELANALQFVAGIGNHVILIAEVEGQKVKLGNFNIYNVRIDRDGNCNITFKSNIEQCFVGNFEKLMVEEAQILFKAKVIQM